MKITKRATYTLEMTGDDLDQIILALEYASDHLDHMTGPKPGTTRFDYLRSELEAAL